MDALPVHALGDSDFLGFLYPAKMTSPERN